MTNHKIAYRCRFSIIITEIFLILWHYRNCSYVTEYTYLTRQIIYIKELLNLLIMP